MELGEEVTPADPGSLEVVCVGLGRRSPLGVSLPPIEKEELRLH